MVGEDGEKAHDLSSCVKNGGSNVFDSNHPSSMALNRQPVGNLENLLAKRWKNAVDRGNFARGQSPVVLPSNALAGSYGGRGTAPVQPRERSARLSILVSFTWKNPFVSVRPGTTGLFEEYPAEGAAKVLVEDGVNEWVEGRVHVSEPERDHERLDRYVDVWEERFRDVQDEEWEPARDEAAHYEAQYQGGSFLLLPRQSPLLSLRIPRLGRLGLDARLVLAGRPAPVPVLPPQLADVPSPENGLAEAKLERLDDGAPRNDAAVRRRRIELGHHVDVDTDAGRPASGRDARLPVTVHGQRRLQAALLHRNRHRHLSNRFVPFQRTDG